MRTNARIPLPQIEQNIYTFMDICGSIRALYRCSILCEMCVSGASIAFCRQIRLCEHLKGKRWTHDTRTQSSCPFYATTFSIQMLLPFAVRRLDRVGEFSASAATDKWSRMFVCMRAATLHSNWNSIERDSHCWWRDCVCASACVSELVDVRTSEKQVEKSENEKEILLVVRRMRAIRLCASV